jgi:pimeloyl-ACP methyl ester carboxylesterase
MQQPGRRRFVGRNGSRPTALLVHDAFSDTSMWTAAIAAIRPDASDCFTVANPLRGLGSDAAYVAATAAAIDGPVVLVGHGYGGAVASVAAATAENVVGLAFVAGFAPDAAESCIDLLRCGGAASAFLEALRPRVLRLPDGDLTELVIDPDGFASVVAGDLPPERSIPVAISQRPVAAAALEEQAPSAGWRDVPSWYLVATADQVVDADTQRFMAARAGATTFEAHASHAVAASRPEAVAELIAAATRVFHRDRRQA